MKQTLPLKHKVLLNLYNLTHQNQKRNLGLLDSEQPIVLQVQLCHLYSMQLVVKLIP